MSVIAHLTWGALMSLFPIVLVGLKYLKEPSLGEKLFPFENLIHLVLLCSVVNVFLQMVVAPVIKNSEYAAYNDVILGICAGLFYASYTLHVGPDDLTETLLKIKNPKNIYFYSLFYWVVIYALIIPFLQRQACFFGPKGY